MNTARPSSLLGRVVLALALSIGFYTLAVAIAGTLVFIPYEIWRVSHDVNVQLTIFCAVSAIVILYSILPRIDAFAAPGPPLAAGDHPRLFKLLEQVANATGQAMPREVYLVPDCNAWVANRGGVVGVGSRRIMGLGLPVLQILSVSEFAAVLAHEFGHYHHGDTALGPWLYRVRQSIGRTLQELAKRKNILVVVFKWYATLFMRITTAVSRRQELGADALAARVAGAGALASGLRALHAWTPIFDVYWYTEVLPVLQGGMRPGIVEGFARFAGAARMTEASQAMLDDAVEAEEDKYDTHPALNRRLAALEVMDDGPMLALEERERAVVLVDGVDGLEALLVSGRRRSGESVELKKVEWKDVGERIWLPIWRKRAADAAQRFGTLRFGDAAGLSGDPAYLAVKMGLVAQADDANEKHQYEAAALYGTALALAMIREGGALAVNLGEDVAVTLRGETQWPFTACRRLATGEISPTEWRAWCERTGLISMPLGSVLEKEG